MNNIEKTIEALVQYVLADNPKLQNEAREDLVDFLNGLNPANTDPEMMVRRFLMKIGVPEHLTGYPYVVKGILLILQDRTYVDNLQYRLYPKVALMCDSNPAKVERGIRRIIEVTWDRSDMDTLTRYFGTMGFESGRPRNGEFLARAANIVRMEMMNRNAQ